MPRYFDLEVSLLGVKPKIWRRFRIIDEATFMNLHYAVQAACGWEDCHLYEFLDAAGKEGRLRPPFSAGQKRIVRSESAEQFDDEDDVPVADDIELRSYFSGGVTRCFYVYDFGDYWEHLVELVRVQELPEEFVRRLLDGARAFPPEDCGGTIGYEECCEAVSMTRREIRKLEDSVREELEWKREWVGDWRPEAFDLEAARKTFDR
jgi:hypothetical protein